MKKHFLILLLIAALMQPAFSQGNGNGKGQQKKNEKANQQGREMSDNGKKQPAGISEPQVKATINKRPVEKS